jgi:hypothetical protein
MTLKQSTFTLFFIIHFFNKGGYFNAGWKNYFFVGIAVPVVMLLAGLTYYAYQSKGY